MKVNYEEKLISILRDMRGQYSDGRDDDERQFEAYATRIVKLFRSVTKGRE